MTLMELGALGEFVGAIAVVITLLYLALQIRQTNSIARTDSYTELIKQFYDLNQLVVTDAALREALYLPEGHTADQFNQVYSFAILKCNNWMHVETAYREGRIDADLYNGVKKDVSITVEVWPVMRAAVQQWRDRYADVADTEIFSDLS